MRYAVSPVWDTRHRLTAAVTCALVLALAVPAGIFQSLIARYERDFGIDIGPEWTVRGGAALLAAIVVAHLALNGALFLMANRRRAALLAVLLFLLSGYLLGRIFTDNLRIFAVMMSHASQTYSG